MLSNMIPVRGKTFSLFGNDADTHGYYRTVATLTTQLLEKYESPEALLKHLKAINPHPIFKQFFSSDSNHPMTDDELLEMLGKSLFPYLMDIQKHLKSLSFFQRFDKILRAPGWRYFLYMIEIELTNCLNNQKFLNCDTKIAFLPHCLRDFTRECQATSDGIDYLCRRCSKICFVNEVSEILKAHQIQPYIWMQVNLKTYLCQLIKEGKNVGVLGIACIPELVNGMRRCTRFRISVVGIPLNANRCRRWMGQFYENSVDLEVLMRLVGGTSV